jgi:hypothetical protein
MDPSFTYSGAGYSSFRALLNDAVSRGRVTISPAPRGSDVVVEEVGNEAPVTPGVSVLRSVRKDVWEAFVDWSADANYAFERASGRVIHPESDGEVDGREIIKIPSAKRSEHLVWMRNFSELEPDKSLRADLLAALADPQPTRAFARLLQENTAIARRWKRYLRTCILGRASTWAAENDVPISSLELTAAASLPRRESTYAVNARGDEVARERILAILADMPLGELLQLRIPVEYALRR